VGVDGGGTGCQARIADASGVTLGEGSAGPANLATNSEQARSNILSACALAATEAGLTQADLARSSAVLGIAGANVLDCIKDLETSLPFRNTYICSDGQIALHGALGTSNGVVAIIGTGSVYYQQYNGDVASVGGWGSLLGDQSGGAWLGRSLLEYTLLAMDGVKEHSPLTKVIASSFNDEQVKLVIGPDSLIEHCNDDKPVATQSSSHLQRWSPDLLAAYAQDIATAATNGDAVATTLMKKGAKHIEATVTGTSMGQDQSTPLCLLGGLGPSYKPWLSTRIQSRLSTSKNDSLHGAIAMAMSANGNKT